MTLDFSGQQVWVTGAGQGIGWEIAQQFQHAGAEVMGLDQQFSARSYPFRCVSLDISDPQQVQQVCQQLLEQQPRVDVLVNAAGILRLGTTDSLTLDDWQQSWAVNVCGPFYLLRQLIPQFKQQCSGVIVNLASNAAHVPRLQMTAYCVSKAALVSLSHCVGLELAAYGVRCNVVSPGSTDTAMLRHLWQDGDALQRTINGMPEQFKLGIPLGKIAQPQDVAHSVLFLASPYAGHITLQDIVIDGGATLAA